jgi:AcrR family transcriptional regulator
MRKTNLRPHILETAGALFARKGYGNVGINEILKAGEIARASFYHHFKSKEALCAAWLETIHTRSVEQHRDLLASNHPPQAILIEYFESLKDWLVKNDFRGCPYTNTSTFLLNDVPKIRDAIATHKIFIRDFFIELAGRIRPENSAREFGELLFLLYSGATTEAQNIRATWPVDRAAEAAQRLSK